MNVYVNQRFDLNPDMRDHQSLIMTWSSRVRVRVYRTQID